MPHIKNMKETLRYPGHVEYIRVLKESGFFRDEIIDDLNISVLDLTSKVLFKEWKLDPHEEFTVMRYFEGFNKNGNKENNL